MDSDPLASWNDGPAKRAIVELVERVTHIGGSDHLPAAERVAVFDNDGTLWCEKPLPVQADFLFRRIGEMAARDPTLSARQPWKAVVEKDYAWLGGVIAKHYRGDDSDLEEMAGGILAAYADTTIEDFATAAKAFLTTAENPTLERRYVECIYAPMRDLLRYLAANGFTSYLVSGGGRDFVRAAAGPCYGIPPDHVIGSSAALKYRDDGPFATLVQVSKIGIFDDGTEKPVAIWEAIGRRPILAGGNANGDIPMLHFCAHPSRPSLALLVDHDDEQREFAYQAGAEEALAIARKSAWTVVSVKNDWKTVFAD
ncbi:MAG TPA: HAD family hydrolase [Polyangia bacterium]|jgi:phosphoserine phosphatase|nr:HAD family hydrolase [Polyangia bacterium]